MLYLIKYYTLAGLWSITFKDELWDLSHKIYRQQMDGYLAFVKKHINP